MSDTRSIERSAVPPTDDGTGIVGFIRRRPLTAFLLWFFTVGEALAFTPVVARVYDVELDQQVFVLASTLVGLLLPAVVITRLADGPEAVRQLWRRSVAVWVSLRWYALALAGATIGATVVAVAFFGAPTAGLTVSSVTSALVFGLLVQTVVALVPNNWAEEVAWMGFFQSRLQERTGSAMRAVLLTAPLFAFQHVVLVIGLPPVMAVGFMVFALLVMIPFRAVMAWTYNHTGSLFFVGFVHAASNATAGGSGFGDGFLPRLYPDEPFVGIVHNVAFAVFGIALLVATRGRLGLSRRRTPAVAPTPAS